MFQTLMASLLLTAGISYAVVAEDDTVLDDHTDSVDAVSFSPDGTLLLSGSSDDTAKLRDAKSFKILATLKGHTDSVLGVAFSPDGKFAATASADHSAKLWDLAGKLVRTFSGHTDSINGLAFSPDGKLLATASDDETIRVWDGR